MLAALVATSLVALAASAGLFGSGNPGKPVSDVPAVSRPLVQRAIIELPERQHSQVLAYSRRADELARLRELPASPVRAVVEYAEHAQKATDGAPPAETAGASAPGNSASESVVVASADPAAPVTTGATRIATQAAIPPAAHPDALSPPAAATSPAAGETDVAAIETGPEATEAATASDQEKPKRRHGLHVRKARPRTARLTPVPLPRRILPEAETGFPIDAPKAPAQTWTPAAPAPAPVPTRTAQAPTLFQDRSKDTTLDTRVEAGR